MVSNAGRILITGGTGFIGSFLAAELFRHNWEILFLVRPKRKGMNAAERLRHLFDDFHQVPRAAQRWEIIEGDIEEPFCGIDETQRRSLKGQINAIWHLAASLSFKKQDCEETFRTNVRGTTEVLRLAESLGSRRLFYMSTAYVNGIQHGLVREDFLDRHAKHRNPYEASKCQAEALVREWASVSPYQGVIFRPSIVIGDSRDGRTLSFSGYYVFMQKVVQLRNWLRQALEKNKAWPKLFGIRQQDEALIIPLPFFYVPGATVNLIPIDRLIHMMLYISEQPECVGRTFHLVHPNPQTVRFHFESFFDAMGIRGVWFVPINRSIVPILATGTRIAIWALPWGLRKTLRPLSAYLDYLRGEPTFSMEETRAIVPEKDLPTPLTKRAIRRLTAYAEAHHFGRLPRES